MPRRRDTSKCSTRRRQKSDPAPVDAHGDRVKAKAARSGRLRLRSRTRLQRLDEFLQQLPVKPAAQDQTTITRQTQLDRDIALAAICAFVAICDTRLRFPGRLYLHKLPHVGTRQPPTPSEQRRFCYAAFPAKCGNRQSADLLILQQLPPTRRRRLPHLLLIRFRIHRCVLVHSHIVVDGLPSMKMRFTWRSPIVLGVRHSLVVSALKKSSSRFAPPRRCAARPMRSAAGRTFRSYSSCRGAGRRASAPRSLPAAWPARAPL